MYLFYFIFVYLVILSFCYLDKTQYVSGLAPRDTFGLGRKMKALVDYAGSDVGKLLVSCVYFL